jgi:hypothetical protein
VGKCAGVNAGLVAPGELNQPLRIQNDCAGSLVGRLFDASINDPSVVSALQHLADLLQRCRTRAISGRRIVGRHIVARPIVEGRGKIGADGDSGRAIRLLIALMVLCCDPLAIVLTAAASARRSTAA